MRSVTFQTVGLAAVVAAVVACGSSQPASSPSGGGGGGGGGGGEGGGSGGGGPIVNMAPKQLATIKAVEEAFEARDAKKFGALFTDDVTLNVSGRPDVHGRAGAEQGFAHVMSTYGKARFKAKRVFTKGDVAIVEWTMSGTHEGALHGIDPTHKPVGFNGAEVDRFAPDGRIKERHLYFDQATPLGQIGKPIGDGVRPVPADDGGAVAHVASTNNKEESDNVALLDRINRAWESRDEAKWSALLADDVEWDDFAFTKPAKGKDAVRSYFRIFSTAFPEVTSSTVNAWGVGSFVIEEGTFSGVQKGPYMNVPPTSQMAVLYELNIVELSGGKIKKGTTYSNELDMREQLGQKLPNAAPSKTPPGKKK